MDRVVKIYKEELIKQHDFEIYTDASPYGLGAFLINMNEPRAPVEYICARYPDNYMHCLDRLFKNDVSEDYRRILISSSSSLTETRDCSGDGDGGFERIREPNMEIYRYFPGYDSNLVELYACVTSLYTWIRQIKKSRVVIYTDSATTFNLFNNPMSKNLNNFKIVIILFNSFYFPKWC